MISISCNRLPLYKCVLCSKGITPRSRPRLVFSKTPVLAHSSRQAVKRLSRPQSCPLGVNFFFLILLKHLLRKWGLRHTQFLKLRQSYQRLLTLISHFPHLMIQQHEAGMGFHKQQKKKQMVSPHYS